MQSFSDAELIWMNRAHSSADSLRCIDEIEKAGFSDYSIDLIYGSPLLDNQDWSNTIDTVINKKIPHLVEFVAQGQEKMQIDISDMNALTNVDDEVSFIAETAVNIARYEKKRNRIIKGIKRKSLLK